MGKVLHVLLNQKGLDRYPSVYNALYCWAKLGWSNHIISSWPTEEFRHLIEKQYQFSGGYVQRAAQLAFVPGYFDIVIMYDPQDVEAFYATRWLFPRNAYGTFVHHCLEIPAGGLSGGSVLTNCLHKILSGGYQLIDHLIVQDHSRSELFFTTFPYLRGMPVDLVSNSFINAIEPVASGVSWYDELRAQSQFLVLYTGTIARWALSETLLDRLREISHATFLLSGWSEDGYAEKLAARYRTAKNIRFHIGAKSRAVFNYMVAHSDAGLVWYESLDPNVTKVGLSSGKMHKFLSFQKPVVASCIPSLHDFIAAHGFGVSVANHDICGAIQQIYENYQSFTKNIRVRYSMLCNYEREYMAFAHELIRGVQMSHHVSHAEQRQAGHIPTSASV